jgi:NAD-dependent dihydropyrimidine dehydrogenase PreA subunit
MAARTGHFYIDETCIGCGACDHACPGKVDAIYCVENDYLGRFAIRLEDCIDCGFCVPLCPVACIHDARKEGIVEGEGCSRRVSTYLRSLRPVPAWHEGQPCARCGTTIHGLRGGSTLPPCSVDTDELIVLLDDEAAMPRDRHFLEYSSQRIFGEKRFGCGVMNSWTSWAAVGREPPGVGPEEVGLRQYSD